MTEAILHVRGITFTFSEQQIFSNFTTEIPLGITYIVGDESCGKSTLLRLIAGDLIAQSGNISLNVLSQTANQTNSKAQIKKITSWIDPRTSQYDQISPNAYFEIQRQQHAEFDDDMLLEMIEGLSLHEHVSKTMFMLSAGSKRKVWLAAAFASSAKLTLLDEPFAALDKASINFLIEKLNNVAQETERALVIADYAAPTILQVVKKIDLSNLLY